MTIPPQLILFRECSNFEVESKDGSCKECDYGFYLLQFDRDEHSSLYLDDAGDHYECHICFEHAVCFGGDKIAPRDGYFRYRND